MPRGDEIYESPAYWELQKTISHWETVRWYIDLARKFRSMTYDSRLILKTENNGMYDGGRGGSEITVLDSLKNDMLNSAADRCEEIAVRVAASELPPVDIRAAAKV